MGMPAAKPVSSVPPKTVSKTDPPTVAELRLATERLAAWRKADMSRANQRITNATRRMRRIARKGT